MKRPEDPTRDPASEARDDHATEPRCRHLSGYWINRSAGTFRCYGCQHQFRLSDLMPLRSRRIEAWTLNPSTP